MVTRGEGSGQTVINGDKGGGGVKNWDFYGVILFEWPLSATVYILQQTAHNLFN